MQAEIDHIIGEFPQLTDFRGIRDRIERSVAAGDIEFVVALGSTAAATYGARNWIVDDCSRTLLHASTPEKVAAALRIVAATKPEKKQAGPLAARLAGSLEPEDAIAAFAQAGAVGPIADELRACLLHEFILRGITVTEHDEILRWASSAHWSGHPLRALPLERTPYENSLALRQFNKHGSSVGLPFSADDSPALSRHTRLALPRAEETTEPAVAAQLEQAVANWQRESNGRIEARTFALRSIPDPTTTAALLDTLSLECLRARHPSATELVVTPSTPARVWSILFAAAANGGAYNSGAGAAFGRLHAWRSLGALCGATEFDAVDHIARLAEDCHWYTFEADTAWFERVAWDIGIAVLTPEPTLSVLAATDTD
ncbi:DUF6183 family protein [Nocardia sp. NPDC058633]|uniref:DUF6183 family protein n=1 Tax=Nocardia sp. NPDC058633 TaxID=3346568 RepID=UPI003652C155